MMKTGVILCALAVTFQFASCIPALPRDLEERPERLLLPLVERSSADAPERMMGKPSEVMEEPYTNMTIDQLIMMAYGGSADDMRPENLEDENKKLAELDMVLTKNQFLALYGSQTGRVKRKAVRNTVYRWTNRVMPYEFAPQHFSDYDIQTINFAMDEWQTRTCLKFRPANQNDENKVRFQNGYGCNSQLGMVGGSQALNLQSPGCRWRGLYLHEIGHAIGLVHEHQLPERNDFIDIVWDNVEPSFKIWFNTYEADFLNRYNVSYDLNSVMHYGITAFSKDGKSQTIRAKDRSKEDQLGQVWKKELAFSDVKIVNRMYGCNDHCPKNIKCGEDGFIDKNCKCVCPEDSITCKLTSGGDTCYDKFKTHFCQYWAEEGECEKSAKWMKENCQMSCKLCKSTKPVECTNAHTSQRACKLWAEQGECKNNPNWMIPNCRLSCGRCTPGATTTTSKPVTTTTVTSRASCKDLYSDKQACRSWASSGECENNPDWMIPNCRKSCGKCPTTTTSSATITTEPTTTTSTTTTTTPTTTTQTQPTVNCRNEYYDLYCDYYKSIGECTRIPDWMHKYCKKACGVCNKRGSCVNSYPDDQACDYWAKVGECQRLPSWMATRCQRSCGLC